MIKKLTVVEKRLITKLVFVALIICLLKHLMQ